MKNTFELRQVFTRAGNRSLLAIDHWAVPQGRVCYLSGRNGAGKTTLLKITAGLLRPDHAVVRMGRSEDSWGRWRKRLREACVYLHQRPFMFDSDVWDNLAYGLEVNGCGRKQRARRVAQALEWAGLGHLARNPARSLSGGEQQWLALARAWVLDPAVLLLDEPIANMDTESRQKTCFLLKGLAAQGMGVVITSHESTVFASLAQEHWHLQDACLHARPSPAESVRPPRRLGPNVSELHP